MLKIGDEIRISGKLATIEGLYPNGILLLYPNNTRDFFNVADCITKDKIKIDITQISNKYKIINIRLGQDHMCKAYIKI